MKKLPAFFLLLLTGCVALRSDVEAKLVDVNSRIDTLNAYVDTQVKLVGAEVDTKLQAVTHNSGMFSGSGFYVSIVVLGLLASVTILAIIWLRRASNWKTAWRRLSEAIEEQGAGPITDEVKACFTKKILSEGLDKMVIDDLVRRGHAK